VVDLGLEELDFDENELVVETLELAEEGVDQRQGVVVGSLRHEESYEAGLEVLAEEAAALLGCPFYAGLGHGDLDIDGVGDVLEQVKQLSD
jgi:hypothetical protein